jgi:hypothetical protein
MFACFSSCKGSLDRRPFEVIFALERRGLILGCDSLELRIVAAPARDCCKAEKRVLNKVARGQQQQTAIEATGEPPAKKAAKRGKGQTKGQTNTSSAAGSAVDETYNLTVSCTAKVGFLAWHCRRMRDLPLYDSIFNASLGSSPPRYAAAAPTTF